MNTNTKGENKMSEVSVTYFGWDELPEEIREEYIDRIMSQDFHPCDRMNFDKACLLAQELYEEEMGR